MSSEEIFNYVDQVIRSNFSDFASQRGDMVTSPEGDGRFFGKVEAMLYTGLILGRDFYLAIGQTDKNTQIIKLGDSECLTPEKAELDLLLLKELNIEIPPEETQAN